MKWKVVKLNNPPKEDSALNNFNKNAKAIKVSWKEKGKNFNTYLTPKTVAGLLRMSANNLKSNKLVMEKIDRLRNEPPNKIVFKNPETRANVRRKNLDFVILAKKSFFLGRKR